VTRVGTDPGMRHARNVLIQAPRSSAWQSILVANDPDYMGEKGKA
jgi:hypothetical protein